MSEAMTDAQVETVSAKEIAKAIAPFAKRLMKTGQYLTPEFRVKSIDGKLSILPANYDSEPHNIEWDGDYAEWNHKGLGSIVRKGEKVELLFLYASGTNDIAGEIILNTADMTAHVADDSGRVMMREAVDQLDGFGDYVEAVIRDFGTRKGEILSAAKEVVPGVEEIEIGKFADHANPESDVDLKVFYTGSEPPEVVAKKLRGKLYSKLVGFYEVVPVKATSNPDQSLGESDEEIDAIDQDYGLKRKIDRQIEEHAKEAIRIFHSLFPIYESPRIVFVKNIESLGLYRGETESNPIIMLSDKNMVNSARDHGVDLKTVVQTTVWHELAHAVVDLAMASELGHLVPEIDEEEFVEGVAHAIWSGRSVSPEFEKIVDALIGPQDQPLGESEQDATGYTVKYIPHPGDWSAVASVRLYDPEGNEVGSMGLSGLSEEEQERFARLGQKDLNYAHINWAEIKPEHRGKKLYGLMLKAAVEGVKSQGSDGVSTVAQTSDSKRVWDKIKNKKTLPLSPGAAQPTVTLEKPPVFEGSLGEMAKPTKAIANKVYYHGTSKEASALERSVATYSVRGSTLEYWLEAADRLMAQVSQPLGEAEEHDRWVSDWGGNRNFKRLEGADREKALEMLAEDAITRQENGGRVFQLYRGASQSEVFHLYRGASRKEMLTRGDKAKCFDQISFTAMRSVAEEFARIAWEQESEEEPSQEELDELVVSIWVPEESIIDYLPFHGHYNEFEVIVAAGNYQLAEASSPDRLMAQVSQPLDESTLIESTEIDEFFDLAGSYDDWFDAISKEAEEELKEQEPDSASWDQRDIDDWINSYIQEAEEWQSSTMIFFREPRWLPRGTWLVRHTEKNPINFAKDFLNGTVEGSAPENLGLTLHEKTKPGNLIFAFTLENAKPKGSMLYGKNAVLIQVERAVEAIHRSDGDSHQVVFDLDDVLMVVPLIAHSGQWVVFDEHGEFLFSLKQGNGVFQKIIDKLYKKPGRYPIAQALGESVSWRDLVRGEWWLEKDGFSHFADIDVGEAGHEGIAISNLLSEFESEFAEALEALPPEEQTEDIKRFLDRRESEDLYQVYFGSGIPDEVGQKAMGNLWGEIKKDARRAYMKHAGAIMVIDSNFAAWTVDAKALKVMQDFMWEQLGDGDGDYAEALAEGEIGVEEVSTGNWSSMPAAEFLDLKGPRELWR